jgi:TRAP-type C4-dicarboxylate transport system substrate-binding protein
VLPLDSHYGVAGAASTKIEELSGGEITINLKPAGALGGERDVIEGLQIGSIELTITSTGPVGNFVPAVYALDFPFLFDSYEQARDVLDWQSSLRTTSSASHGPRTGSATSPIRCIRS